MNDLSAIAKTIRKSILHMNHRSNASHSGSCLSVVDLLVLLYFDYLRIDPRHPSKPERDRFILSKGHASAALYATLAERGFFGTELLERFYVDNGTLPGHIDMCAAPGLECAAGSLGHGLPVGCGMAIGLQRNQPDARVVVIISDGELNEGSIWESILLAPHLKLRNLTLIIDYNKIQSFGITNEVINLEPLTEKLTAFNWHVSNIDGHDFNQIRTALAHQTDQPKVIIAHTVKGKGVSFMENKLEWHYRSPNPEQLATALLELQ